MLHVLHDCLLANGLFDTMLRLDVEWVCIEGCDLALADNLCLLCTLSVLSQELSESCGVGLCSRCYFRLCLSAKGGGEDD